MNSYQPFLGTICQKTYISKKNFWLNFVGKIPNIQHIFCSFSAKHSFWPKMKNYCKKCVFFGSNFVIFGNLSLSPTKRVQMWSKMIRPAYCPQNIDDFVFLNHLNIFSGLWVMCNLVMVGVFVNIIFSWKKSCFWSNIPYFTPSEHKKLSSLEC